MFCSIFDGVGALLAVVLPVGLPVFVDSVFRPIDLDSCLVPKNYDPVTKLGTIDLSDCPSKYGTKGYTWYTWYTRKREKGRGEKNRPRGEKNRPYECRVCRVCGVRWCVVCAVPRTHTNI